MATAQLRNRKIRPGLLLADYLVEHPLGAGGMGQVFAATHARTGQRVAIKTLLAWDPSGTEYFRREIEVLAGLRHPGVVRFHDFGVFCDQPWYAMDLLEGATLRSVLQQRSPSASGAESASPISQIRTTESADDRPSAPAAQPSTAALMPELSAEQLLRVCMRVLLALEYVHSRGVVHGDLKPENIFLLSEEEPVLVDFGVASPFDRPRERLTLLPRSVGSIAYMSPERLRGALPDARADLYALGCVLYECLTGVHPFLRDTIEATTLAHLKSELVPPSRVRASISPQLDVMLDRLLAKSPADRLGYARDVVEVLASSGVLDDEEPESMPRSEHLFRTPLVGRAELLDSLRARLDRASEGVPTKVLLTGSPGLGKTRLLLETVGLATREGCAVVHLECAAPEEAEIQPWLQPLKALVRALAEQSFGQDSARTLQASRAALDLLVDERPGSPSAPLERTTAREDLVQNLTSAVLERCRERTLVFAIDDLHRADEVTREFLQHLTSSSPAGTRLLLICSEVEHAATDFAHSGLFEPIALQPLGEVETELAVRACLAVEHPSPTLIRGAYRVSQGNPLILGEYLRALIGSGVLRRDRHKGWHLSLAPGASLADDPWIESAAALVEWRIQGLAGIELELAEIAALMNAPFDIESLALVAKLTPDDVRTAVRALCRRHLLERRAPERYRLTDASLGRSLAGRVPARRATRIHRRAAAVLLSRRPELAAPSTLAFHASRCGAHRRAARFFVEAARRHLHAFRRQDALDAFTEAVAQLARSPAAELRQKRELVSVYEELGDVAMGLRKYGQAQNAYGAALALVDGNRLLGARLCRKLAGAHQRGADRGMGYLARALALVDRDHDRDVEEQAEWIQVNLDTMWVHYWNHETESLLATAERVTDMVQAHGTARQRASLHFNLAVGLMQRNRYVTGALELSHIERAQSIYEELQDRPNSAMCRFVRSMICLFSGDIAAAEAGLESVLASADRAASVTIRIRALTFLGLAQRKRRARERVRKSAAAALSLATEHDMPEYRGTAMANLAWVALQDGERLECERLVRSAVEAWEGSPLNVFRWTGLFPLMAVLVQREERAVDHGELASIAGDLLNPSQQALPAELAHALQAVQSAEDACSARTRTRTALARAAESGFL